MSTIAPAILASTLEEYRHDLENVLTFAARVQIDLADGDFAPNKTINLAEAHWPENLQVDLHLMIQNPYARLPEIISLNPDLAIIHAEADGDLENTLETLRSVDIKPGLALLQQTEPEEVHKLIEKVDHVLIFTGELGHYGGKTDIESLHKIPKVKEIKPDVEIGVDGGINNKNAKQIVRAGADVLNVGSFIQKADNPKKAYDKLVKEVEKAVEDES